TPCTRPNSAEIAHWLPPGSPRGSIVSSDRRRSSTRKAQTASTAAGFVHAADIPAAAVDGSPGGPRRARSQGLLGGTLRALQLHRRPCDFCHAADFLPDSLSEEPNFCSLSQIDYRWGMLHE